MSGERLPARLFRVGDHCDPALRRAAFGDLIYTPDGTWAVRRATKRVEYLDTLYGEPLGVIIDTRLTDRFANALVHYTDCARQASALGTHLVVIVRPTDIGFRRAFPMRESERLLVAQWTAVAVVLCGDDWWLFDVAFFSHLPQTSDHYVFTGPRVIQRALWVFTQHDAPIAGRNPEVHVTRDLSLLVAVYRDWLQAPKTAYLVLRSGRNWSANMYDLISNLDTCLESRRWRCTDLLFDIKRSDEGVCAVRIIGPPETFDGDEFAVAIAGVEWSDSTRLEAVVERRSAQRSRNREYERLERRVSHFTTASFSDEWRAPPEHQWPRVHDFLLEHALAFAPLQLPTYVVLWLLEWLPEMRHHVHIQALRLLEAVAASARRVVARRATK